MVILQLSLCSSHDSAVWYVWSLCFEDYFTATILWFSCYIDDLKFSMFVFYLFACIHFEQWSIELVKMILMLLEGFNSISGCWSVCTYNVIKQQVLVVIIFVESFVFVQLCNCLYCC